MSDPQLDELHAFIERWPSMIGQDDDLIHSVWVDMMDHPLECRVSSIRRLFAKVVRLESKLKRRELLIARQRYVIHLLFRMGGWQMNGEGKHRHLNRGGTSYFGVENTEGKVLMSSALECRIIDDAMKERKRDGLD